MRVRQPCSEAEAQVVRSCQHWDLFGPILGSILHLNLTDDAERVFFCLYLEMYALIGQSSRAVGCVEG